VPLKLFSAAEKETTFEVCYSLSPSATHERSSDDGLGNSSFNYTSFAKRIKSHFAKLNNPVERFAETKRKQVCNEYQTNFFGHRTFVHTRNLSLPCEDLRFHIFFIYPVSFNGVMLRT
jgi:hypothetical protein